MSNKHFDLINLANIEKKISKKKFLKIQEQKQIMQNQLSKFDEFSDRLEYVTFTIQNIFNIINDENLLTFKEYVALNRRKRNIGKKYKKLKKVKKWKN